MAKVQYRELFASLN